MKFNIPKSVKNAHANIAGMGKRGVAALIAAPASMLAAGSAFAQGGLGEAAMGHLASLETNVQNILVVLVGVVFLLVLYSYLKKAK